MKVFTYLVIAAGFLGRLYSPGDEIVSEKELPRATWYEPEGGWENKPKTAKKKDSDGTGDGKDKKPDVLKISEIPDPAAKQERTDALQNAFESLDVTNDEHWTTKGAPKMDALNDVHEGDDFFKADVTAEMTRDALTDMLTSG